MHMVSFAVEFDKFCAKFFTDNFKCDSHGLEARSIELHFSIFGNKDQVGMKHKTQWRLCLVSLEFFIINATILFVGVGCSGLDCMLKKLIRKGRRVRLKTNAEA